MKTQLRYYFLDIGRSPGKSEYANIKARTHGKPFQTKYFSELFTMDLEMVIHGALPDNVFECSLAMLGDSGLNHKVRAWCEYPHRNPMIKEGYWLDVTNEMIDLQDNTYVCQGCKTVTTNPRFAFCMECVEKPSAWECDLHLFYWSPVSVGVIDRKNILITEWVKKKYRDAHGIT